MEELKAKIADAIAGLSDEQIEEAIGMSKHAGKVDVAALKAAVG